jgi:hypothetical protein
VTERARLDGGRFLLQVERLYYPEFESHRLDITGQPGFAVEAVVVDQVHQPAVFRGAQMETILVRDGLDQPYLEQMEAFPLYYQEAVQSHTMPVQLRQYG